MKVTAIIPAKGYSRRLLNKNMLPFGDSTLIGHKVDQLRRCPAIHEVVVGTDSDAIAAEAEAHGAVVRRRDAYHCDESVCSANEMIRNLVAMVECDVVLWAHCTNPLVKPVLYALAIDAFKHGQGFDSLCSVTKIQRHAWARGAGVFVPDNFDPSAPRHPFASELAPRWYQDGAIFIQPHEQMLHNAYFYGDRPKLYEIDQPYGWDIDTETDLQIAQWLYAGLHSQAAATGSAAQTVGGGA